MLESLMIQGKLGSGSEVPTEIGTFWEGGYYVGKIQVVDKIYALVLAPKAQGASPIAINWKSSLTSTPGTGSLSDGWSNTQAMITAGAIAHPAAKYCRDLVIDGYDDWYLPAVDELEMCYRAFKPSAVLNNVSTAGRPNGPAGYNRSSIPIGASYTASSPGQTSVTIFRSGGSESFIDDKYYWSSTQTISSERYAWAQVSSNGIQNSLSKTAGYHVRAVRRVLIE